MKTFFKVGLSLFLLLSICIPVYAALPIQEYEHINVNPVVDLVPIKNNQKQIDIAILTDYTSTKYNALVSAANNLKSSLYAKNVIANVKVLNDTDKIPKYDLKVAKGYTVDVYEYGFGVGWSDYILNIVKIVNGKPMTRLCTCNITNNAFLPINEINNAIQVQFLTPPRTVCVLDVNGSIYKVTYTGTGSSINDASIYSLTKIDTSILDVKEKVIKIGKDRGEILALTNKGRLLRTSSNKLAAFKQFDGVTVSVLDFNDSFVLSAAGNIYCYGNKSYYDYNGNLYSTFWDYIQLSVNADGLIADDLFIDKSGYIKRIEIVSGVYSQYLGQPNIVTKNMYVDKVRFDIGKFASHSGIYYTVEKSTGKPYSLTWRYDIYGTNEVEANPVTGVEDFKFFMPFYKVTSGNYSSTGCGYQPSVGSNTKYGYEDADTPATHLGYPIIDLKQLYNFSNTKIADDRYCLLVSDGEGNALNQAFGTYYGMGNIDQIFANYLEGNNYNLYSVSAASTYSYKLVENVKQKLSINEVLSYVKEGKTFDKGLYQDAFNYILSNYQSSPNTQYDDAKKPQQVADLTILTDYTGIKLQDMQNVINDYKSKLSGSNVDLQFRIVNNKIDTTRTAKFNYKIMNTTDNVQADWYSNFFDFTYNNYYDSDPTYNYNTKYKLLEIFNPLKCINGVNDIVMATKNVEYAKYPGKSYNYGLRNDGTVWYFASNGSVRVPGLNNIIQIISYGGVSLYALDKYGKVFLYGNDLMDMQRPVAIACTQSTPLPSYKYYSPIQIPEMTSAKYITPLPNSGELWIEEDGDVIYYGPNFATSSTFTSVRQREWDPDLGKYVYIWVDQGTVVNIQGKAPFNLTTLLSLPKIKQAFAFSNQIYFVTEDGRLLSWRCQVGNPTDGANPNYMVTTDVLGRNDVKSASVSPSGLNMLVVLTNGTVLAKGENKYGQLGLGTTTAVSNFTVIPGLSNIDSVLVNDWNAGFLDKSGNLYRTGAVYYTAAFWSNQTAQYQVTTPTLCISNVNNFMASPCYYTVVTKNREVKEMGYYWYNSGRTLANTWADKGIIPELPTSILNGGDNYNVFVCPTGNYTIGNITNVLNDYTTYIYSTITKVDKFNGYSVVGVIGDSVYLKDNIKPGVYCGIGVTSSGRFSIDGNIPVPVDVTTRFLNGKTLAAGDKIIWLANVMENNSYPNGQSTSYNTIFTFTKKQNTLALIESNYQIQDNNPAYVYPVYNSHTAQVEMGRYGPGGCFSADMWTVAQTGWPYRIADSNAYDMWMGSPCRIVNIEPVYTENYISYVDADGVKNLALNQNSKKYFIYISDGEGYDFSKAFGQYYGFGNLTSSFKDFLVLKNYSVNAIVPISTYDFLLPQSDIQNMTIRQLVRSSPAPGRLFARGQIEEAMNYLFGEYLKVSYSGLKVIVSEDYIDYAIQYSDYENHPKDEELWKYIHNPNYFENSMGIAEFNNKDLPMPVTMFDKVGQYQVTYKAKDKPTNEINFEGYKKWSLGENQLTIYAHRRPVADFVYTLNSNIITFNDLSYDLDHISQNNRGIIEWLWEWKLQDAVEWNTGKLYSIDPETSYLVRLSVKDLEGAWSYPVAKTITNKLPEIIINPGSAESLNTGIAVNVTVNDKSLLGLNNIKYAITHSTASPGSGWITKTYTGIKTTDTFTVNITDRGEWYLHVQAEDNNGGKAYKYAGVYKVVYIDPLSVAASVTPNPAKQGQKITFKIDTTGNAKYLTLYFPAEIMLLDSSLPLFVTIPEEASHTEFVAYYVPLKTPKTIDNDGIRLRPPYVVQIKAQKADGTYKITNVDLDVKGSILDGIKTEILNN